MKIPYRLARRPSDHPATALMVLGESSAEILGLCARIGLEPKGRVFAVSGGLLLKLDRPRVEPSPQAIRLRKLAENLLIPVDAELLPALLDDEAAGLTRDRGLIFLPDGEILGFDPRSPIDPMSLLTCEYQPRRSWQSLPDPPRLADRIEEIRVENSGGGDDLPGNIEDAILDPGNEDVGSEVPRPGASGAGSTAIGRAAMGAGQGMIWLGKKLGMKGLAGMGAGWVRKAMEMAPRLSEAAIGRQSAALRELLREFREGDPERALRHALPMGDPGDMRGAGFDESGNLTSRDTSYDLDSLLRKDHSAPGSLWLGGQDVMAQLIREYQQAAERAMKRGDHRRAAYIYGKLLRDFRMAAHALLRGGLYRDAAALFLAKLDDPKSAALALESAGDLDRAIDLYRRVGEHEAAGDLLRKIGEEDAAMAEYRLAADRLVASAAGHLVAGDFLWKKTGQADLALEYFREGWRRRPQGNALLCALRIARHHAEGGDVPRLLHLIDEADDFFAIGGEDYAAGKFYEEIAIHADRPNLAEAREDLRDRALMGVARKLKESSEKIGTKPKATITRLMSNLKTWRPAVVRDAEFALTIAAGEKPSSRTNLLANQPTDRLGIGNEKLTAATFASVSDEVFSGSRAARSSASGRGRMRFARDGAREACQCVGRFGRWPASCVVQDPGLYDGRLNAYERKPDGSYRLLAHIPVEMLEGTWLTPIANMHGQDLVGLYCEVPRVKEVAGLTRERGCILGIPSERSPDRASGSRGKYARIRHPIQ